MPENSNKTYRLSNILRDVIPGDSSCQVTSRYYINRFLAQPKEFNRVLDLGCGADSLASYSSKQPSNVEWVGIDIKDSPEVKQRDMNNSDNMFSFFDGINIPFKDNHFDVIYSKQVFEHVRYPEKLLKDSYRVLKPGGYLIGSTSQLEPYHSYSVWNYTPYGFSLLLSEAGYNLEELRPSIDSLTLILRRGLGRPAFFNRWWEKESPLNRIISILGVINRKDHKWINSMKLLFCGQFNFCARK